MAKVTATILRVVEDAPARERGLDPLLECQTCRADTGHAGTTFLEVRRMPVLDKKLRVTGGQKALACVDCLSRGKVTIVT